MRCTRIVYGRKQNGDEKVKVKVYVDTPDPFVLEQVAECEVADDAELERLKQRLRKAVTEE